MRLFVKNLLYTLVLPATFAVYLPLLLVKERTPASAGSVVAAIPLFAIGTAMFVWCVWDFASFGRGTPAPVDAPKRLVIRGLYRYLRNPLYVGVFLVMSGWAVLFQSRRLWIYIAIAAVGFHLFVVLYEERALQRRFGAEYDAYRANVGRWLPRWRRGPAS